MTVLAWVEDPDGRRVELTEERWDHIVAIHPELATLQPGVLAAVQAPDESMPGRAVNERWFCSKEWGLAVGYTWS